MKEKEIIVGIDVSKSTLDVCVLLNGQSESYALKNNTQTVTSFFKRLLKNTNYHVNDYIIDSGSLFSLSSAQITLETKLNLKSTGKAALGLKNVSGRIFAETVEEIKNFLEIEQAGTSNMRNGYYQRNLDTQYGRIEGLLVPRDRNGEFQT